MVSLCLDLINASLPIQQEDKDTILIKHGAKDFFFFLHSDNSFDLLLWPVCVHESFFICEIL